jgi:hypothetical protein
MQDLGAALSLRPEHLELLAAEEIDLEALMVSDDSDLKDIGLPKGARIKLLQWIQTTKAAASAPARAQATAASSSSSHRAGGSSAPFAGPGSVNSKTPVLKGLNATLKVPDIFFCPISTCVMEDPVILHGGEWLEWSGGAAGSNEQSLFFSYVKFCI